jgi:hypothetical protein
MCAFLLLELHAQGLSLSEEAHIFIWRYLDDWRIDKWRWSQDQFMQSFWWLGLQAAASIRDRCLI